MITSISINMINSSLSKKKVKVFSIKGLVDHFYIELINSYQKKKVKVLLKRAEMIIRIRIWSPLVPSSDLGRSRSNPVEQNELTETFLFCVHSGFAFKCIKSFLRICEHSSY